MKTFEIGDRVEIDDQYIRDRYGIATVVGYGLISDNSILHIRFDRYEYTPDDFHYFPVRRLTLAEIEYDPLQNGDTDEDI